MRRTFPYALGFTLIELSIVLVVIGLIVGGIRVGQSLIGAAQVRAQISQIEKYNTAANTFRGKYGYLPGDIKDPDASMFGFLARVQYPGEGNGDGVIQGCDQDRNCRFIVESGGETALFWEDLSQAGLIEGLFNTAAVYGMPIVTLTSTPSISAYMPAAKIGQGNYVYVWGGGFNANSNASDGNNYFGLSAVIHLNTG